MRIVISTVQIPFIRGGAEHLAEGLRDALVAAGHQAEIVAVPFPGPRFVALRETPEFVELAAHLRRVLETC